MIDSDLLSVEEVFDNNFITEEYRCAWGHIKKEYIRLAQRQGIKTSEISHIAESIISCIKNEKYDNAKLLAESIIAIFLPC